MIVGEQSAGSGYGMGGGHSLLAATQSFFTSIVMQAQTQQSLNESSHAVQMIIGAGWPKFVATQWILALLVSHLG